MVAVHDFGAGDILELRPQAGGTTILLPFNEACVPGVDIAGGRIIVALPATTPGKRRRRCRIGPVGSIIMWRASILTIFPDMFPGPLGFSLAGKALAAGLWALDAVDIREYASRPAPFGR